MNRPKRTRPSSGNGLVAWPFIITGIVFILSVAIGCEPQPVRLESTDTTLPAVSPTDPAAIIARQRAAVDAAMEEYYDAMESLTHDRVTWALARVEADVRAMHCARIGDKVGLTKYVQMRRKLEEIGAELDSLEFKHRATLDYLRLEMSEFDAKFPGWWLMSVEKE